MNGSHLRLHVMVCQGVFPKLTYKVCQNILNVSFKACQKRRITEQIMTESVKAIAKGNVSNFPTRGLPLPISAIPWLSHGSWSLDRFQWFWPAGSQFARLLERKQWQSNPAVILRSVTALLNQTNCQLWSNYPETIEIGLGLDDIIKKWLRGKLRTGPSWWQAVGDPWIEMWKPGLWFGWGAASQILQLTS